MGVFSSCIPPLNPLLLVIGSSHFETILHWKFSFLLGLFKRNHSHRQTPEVDVSQKRDWHRKGKARRGCYPANLGRMSLSVSRMYRVRDGPSRAGSVELPGSFVTTDHVLPSLLRSRIISVALRPSESLCVADRKGRIMNMQRAKCPVVFY